MGFPPFLLDICWVEHHIISFHISHHCSILFTTVNPYLIHSVGTEDVRASPGHILGRCSDSSRPSKPCLPFAYGVSSCGRSSFWARHEGQIPRRRKANRESSKISQLVARGSEAERRRVGGTGTTSGRQGKKRRGRTWSRRAIDEQHNERRGGEDLNPDSNLDIRPVHEAFPPNLAGVRARSHAKPDGD